MVAKSEQQYDQDEMLRMLEQEMLEAANNLEFEKAAELRDRIKELKNAPQIRDATSGVT
jgi:excinuclease ABC subunit B